MSGPNEFVTSLNSIQSAFITRQEVIEALSTILPSLSSFSTIAFGTSPNPSFSTITMNPNGQISGYVPIQTSNVIFTTNAQPAGFAQKLILGSAQPSSSNCITAVDVNNSNAPLQGSQVVVRNGAAGSLGGVYQSILPQSNVFTSANGLSQVPYIVWNGATGLTANIALSNISTINGSPPNVNPTTYTTLSGTTINNSGVITTPSVVGVSSLNALPISAYQNSNSQPWVSYAVTNTATSGNLNFTAGVGYTALSFSNCPIPTTSGREVTISIPISYNITTPPASVTTLTIEAFLGGNLTGGTSVSQIVPITPTTSGGRITLCGVATVNGSQPTVNIQTTGGGTFTANFTQGAGTIPRQFFFQTLGF